MKKIALLVVILLLHTAMIPPQHKVTIFLIGDSTMANKDTSDGKWERGWGMELQKYWTDDVLIDNHAKNGRSSKSFIDEGLWKNVIDKVQPGDYVFIQFGHNDEKPQEARHTDPGTTFDANLERYVKETLAKGGRPILFNSVVRRIFNESKTAVTDDDLRSNSSSDMTEGDSLVDTHGAYLISPRNVAEKMGVPFIDANRITHNLEQALGPEASKKLHMWYYPGEYPIKPQGIQDNTHYNIIGANVVALLLTQEIYDSIPELRKYIRR